MKKIFKLLGVFGIVLTFISCQKATDSYETLTLDSTNRISGSNSSGSYGESETTGIGYYRTYGFDDSLYTIILATPTTISDMYPSSIYNINEIKGISEIEITYWSDSNFYIYTSSDRSYENSYEVESSGSFTTLNLTVEKSSFFKVISTTSNVYVQSIIITYDNQTSSSNTNYLTYSDSRINMQDFYTDYDNLEEGEERTIPSDITVNSDGTYTVNEYKTYTYHTYDYVLEHAVEAEDLALTDPYDVAAYYMLFHDFPVNYFYKNDLSDAKSYFSSSSLRQVSYYTRTDGYATSVPYQVKTGESYPEYYELDFDVNGYYTTSNRGVGRLVVWVYGFDATNYDSNPVIVYTDDHYATFKEYLNYGQFGTRFNSEQLATNYNWSLSQTLTK